MNTATAYAARARAAAETAKALALTRRPYTRWDDERAARLADFAQRCAQLAYRAGGQKDSRPMRAAGEYADDTRAAWIHIRQAREAAARRSSEKARTYAARMTARSVAALEAPASL